MFIPVSEFYNISLHFTSTALSRAHGVHLPLGRADGILILCPYITITSRVLRYPSNIQANTLAWVSGSYSEHTITSILQNFVFTMKQPQNYSLRYYMQKRHFLQISPNVLALCFKMFCQMFTKYIDCLSFLSKARLSSL